MKKVLISALLAGLSISAFAELRVAAAPEVAAVPVALAAADLAGVSFVPTSSADLIEVVRRGDADCAVVVTHRAVAVADSLAENNFLIVSGLTSDMNQPLDQKRTVLACVESAADEHAELFDAFSKSVIGQVSDLRGRTIELPAARHLTKKAFERAGLVVSGDEIEAVAASIATTNDERVRFSYVPRDVMYSAGLVRATTIPAPKFMMFPVLANKIRAENKVAM